MTTATRTKTNPADFPQLDARRIVLEPSQPMAGQIEAILNELEAVDYWLDFSEIEKINSGELSSLIRFSLRVRQCDGSLLVSHLSPELEQVFKLTRFDRYCQILEPSSDRV